MTPANIPLAHSTASHPSCLFLACMHTFTSCSAEFLRLIVSEAAEVCAQSKKQLMKPEHVQLALERLGFEYLASSVGEAEVKGKEEVAAASKVSETGEVLLNWG